MFGIQVPKSHRLQAIAAIGERGLIGLDGVLPWYIPEDLKRFRELTGCRPVIMGRQTWESLPDRYRPLPGRLNVVLSGREWRMFDGPGLVGAATPADAVRVAVENSRPGPLSIIGGAKTYATFLEHCELLFLTVVMRAVDRPYCSPTFFPLNKLTYFEPYEFSVSESGAACFVDLKRRVAGSDVFLVERL